MTLTKKNSWWSRRISVATLTRVWYLIYSTTDQNMLLIGPENTIDVWEFFQFNSLQNYWYAPCCSTTWSSDWRISLICRFFEKKIVKMSWTNNCLPQFNEIFELFLVLQNYWYASCCSIAWSSDRRISPICRFGTYGKRRPQKTSENPQAISAKSIGKCLKVAKMAKKRQKSQSKAKCSRGKTPLRCFFG